MARKFFGGTAFRQSQDRSHLWFVISDPVQYPDDLVVYVNMTTLQPVRYQHDPENDQSCVLYVGDHPAVDHLSCIAYWFAHDAWLYRLEADSCCEIHPTPASAELLARMREGAAQTRHLERRMKKILRDQGLI